MKKITLALGILLIVGMSSAVVRDDGSSPSNEADEGQLGITSDSATTSVGPNGTEWELDFSMADATCMANQTSGVHDSNFANESVSFSGTVATSDPCHRLEKELVEQSEGSYRMVITSNATDSDACEQCTGALSYEASFSTDQPFELEVVHDGETVETLRHPEYGEQDEQEGFLASIMNWLGGLFG